MFDCVICGSCVCDILIRPVSLDRPIGAGQLVTADVVEATTGGVVSNTGIAMARLGMKPAAFSYIGDDHWGTLMRQRYRQEGLDDSRLLTHPEASTSATGVLIDPSGERSFAHVVGAPSRLNKSVFLEHLDLFEDSRMTLIGYYSLVPNLDNDLPEILQAIRETGCQTALDTAGDGGSMQPLDKILPHLDFYVPSHAEAAHQTNQSDPTRIIQTYRECGAEGMLGVKLGAQGALLSPEETRLIPIEAVEPPGPIVDTTGAGDSFYAGLLTGLLRQMSVEESGRLAAAVGACCVTGLGASAGIRSFEDTRALV